METSKAAERPSTACRSVRERRSARAPRDGLPGLSPPSVANLSRTRAESRARSRWGSPRKPRGPMTPYLIPAPRRRHRALPGARGKLRPPPRLPANRRRALPPPAPRRGGDGSPDGLARLAEVSRERRGAPLPPPRGGAPPRGPPAAPARRRRGRIRPSSLRPGRWDGTGRGGSERKGKGRGGSRGALGPAH